MMKAMKKVEKKRMKKAMIHKKNPRKRKKNFCFSGWYGWLIGSMDGRSVVVCIYLDSNLLIVYFFTRPKRESKRQKKPKKKGGEESDPFDFEDDDGEFERPTGKLQMIQQAMFFLKSFNVVSLFQF